MCMRLLKKYKSSTHNCVGPKCWILAPYAWLKILEIISRVYRTGLSDGLEWYLMFCRSSTGAKNYSGGEVCVYLGSGFVLRTSGKRLENDKASQSFISLKIYIISIRIVLHLTKLYIPGLCWMETAKHTNMMTACKYSPAMQCLIRLDCFG